MLQDTEYIEKTRRLIAEQRQKMYQELAKLDTFRVYPAYANFILLRILKKGITSFQVFEAAIREKMMIRDCSTFPFLDDRYIRFCIMSPDMNDRLMACILE